MKTEVGRLLAMLRSGGVEVVVSHQPLDYRFPATSISLRQIEQCLSTPRNLMAGLR